MYRIAKVTAVMTLAAAVIGTGLSGIRCSRAERALRDDTSYKAHLAFDHAAGMVGCAINYITYQPASTSLTTKLTSKGGVSIGFKEEPAIFPNPRFAREYIHSAVTTVDIDLCRAQMAGEYEALRTMADTLPLEDCVKMDDGKPVSEKTFAEHREFLSRTKARFHGLAEQNRQSIPVNLFSNVTSQTFGVLSYLGLGLVSLAALGYLYDKK